MAHRTEKHADAIRRSGNGWAADWKCAYEMEDKQLLVELGEREQYERGKKLRKDFPSLFEPKYTPKLYNFFQTQVSRAGQRCELQRCI